MRFGGLVLYSKEPEQLVSFLSSFFEAEPIVGEDAIVCQLFGLKATVLNLSGRKYKSRGETLIELQAESMEELENILSKSKFVEYRLGLKELNKKASIKNEHNFSYLDIQDPDGRCWRVTFFKM